MAKESVKKRLESKQGMSYTKFPLMFLFLFLFFFGIFLIFFYFWIKKKIQNGVVSMGLTAATNRNVTEPYIDKNWKLEDWNEKNVKVKGSVLHFCQKKI